MINKRVKATLSSSVTALDEWTAFEASILCLRNPQLRFCTACSQHKHRVLGYPAWHWTTQFFGVKACPRHRV